MVKSRRQHDTSHPDAGKSAQDHSSDVTPPYSRILHYLRCDANSMHLIQTQANQLSTIALLLRRPIPEIHTICAICHENFFSSSSRGHLPRFLFTHRLDTPACTSTPCPFHLACLSPELFVTLWIFFTHLSSATFLQNNRSFEYLIFVTFSVCLFHFLFSNSPT